MTINLSDAQFVVMERALRERVGQAHHDACMIGSSVTAEHHAQRDAEYREAVALYEHVVGRSPLSVVQS